MDLTKYGITMWDERKIKQFRASLLKWYDENKRDLPWRKTQDPYAIWVSEIMLQQTRVDTVIPYYLRFLEWFPTVNHLAQAPEEQLLKAWEGLGYYSRVRNMQTAAQQIMQQFAGRFPSTYPEIATLKGIGPYTAGAIASIAFQLPEPAVDGNVMRVLSRLFEIPYDIGVSSNRKIYQAVAQRLIDPQRPGDFNQALMDLGSDIEAPVNPRPHESPVKEFSAAYLNNTMDQYPIKAPKKKPTPKQFQAFIIQNQAGDYLLERNQKDLLKGFWHFPLIENFACENDQRDRLPDDKKQVAELDGVYHTVANQGIPMTVQFEAQYKNKVQWNTTIFPQIQHIFSHQRWTIELVTGVVDHFEFATNKELAWVAADQFVHYPFAKPQQKMWEMIQQCKKK